jgi:hypothetical protein
MAVIGKTIQIFLPDGNPKSVRISEITSRTVQVLLVPRSKLEFASTRQELGGVGTYFLAGAGEAESKPLLYVGEAENCGLRLKQHNRSTDFWNQALVVLSKTRYFTKAHIRFLEWICYEKALEASRYRLENAQVPSRPFVPEPVEADLLDIFDTVKVLTSTLGHPVFDPISRPEPANFLFCKGRDALAKGAYTEEGLVVYSGSIANLKESRTAGPWVTRIRRNLIEEGTMVQWDSVLEFRSDHVFSSPSAAAVAVLGRKANGWTAWKFSDGRTLDQVVRKGEPESG